VVYPAHFFKKKEVLEETKYSTEPVTKGGGVLGGGTAYIGNCMGLGGVGNDLRERNDAIT